MYLVFIVNENQKPFYSYHCDLEFGENKKLAQKYTLEQAEYWRFILRAKGIEANVVKLERRNNE